MTGPYSAAARDRANGSELGRIADFDNAPDGVADIGVEAEGAATILALGAVEKWRIAVEQVSHRERDIVAAHESGIEGIAKVQVHRGPGIHGIAAGAIEDAVGRADQRGRGAADIGVGADIV